MTGNIYQKAIHKFGEVHQSIKCLEEMSELSKEICKWLEGDKSEVRVDIIVEEIADVEITISQLKLICGISDCQIDMIKQIKLERLKNLLNKKGELI